MIAAARDLPAVLRVAILLEAWSEIEVLQHTAWLERMRDEESERALAAAFESREHKRVTLASGLDAGDSADRGR